MIANFVPKRWKAVLLVLTAPAVLLLVLLVAFKLSWEWSIWTQKREGDRARDKIEAYRSVHGRLPPDLAAVGVEEGPIYYQIRDEKGYILWFGTTLGESVSYSSRTRRWVEYLEY